MLFPRVFVATLMVAVIPAVLSLKENAEARCCGGCFPFRQPRFRFRSPFRFLLKKPMSADPKADVAERTLSIMLVGDKGVGKTTLARHLSTENRYFPSVTPTIGREFHLAKYPDLGLALHIWDTSGNMRHAVLMRDILHLIDAFIFVYDVNRPETRIAIGRWKSRIQTHLTNVTKPSRQPASFVIGTKKTYPHGENRDLHVTVLLRDASSVQMTARTAFRTISEHIASSQTA
ncbi:hypothetical protein PBRA_000080 [Plasmodiophora brassicae]|uniref:Uncharacterized protein n=1 Tax=Plasmodiophora brassicae TaxID=37360 RepID=A0A0G4IGR4_PLABS|nr:hypothetical protein PBRA_000080 [Plasmodiophora brassicae]